VILEAGIAVFIFFPGKSNRILIPDPHHILQENLLTAAVIVFRGVAGDSLGGSSARFQVVRPMDTQEQSDPKLSRIDPWMGRAMHFLH
jgi:hypothetical protein